MPAEAHEELDRIARAIIEGTVEVLDEFGGLQGRALKRAVAHENDAGETTRPAALHSTRSWRTTRLASPSTSDPDTSSARAHGRTCMCKRRGVSMHTSVPGPCTPARTGKPFRTNDLRPPDRGGRGRSARLCGAGSDPSVRGPATGSGPGGSAHPGPVPSGRSQTSDPLAGRRFERRFEAADNPFADRQTVERSRIAAQGRDAPVTGSPWPSRTGLLDGRDPAATGRMGLSGSILSDAKRGMAERGVSPIHVKGTRIGIGAPPTVAQLPTRQRFA